MSHLSDQAVLGVKAGPGAAAARLCHDWGALSKQMPLGLGRQYLPRVGSPTAAPQVPTLLGHVVACSYCTGSSMRIGIEFSPARAY